MKASKAKEVVMFEQPCQSLKIQALQPAKPNIESAPLDPLVYWKTRFDIKHSSINIQANVKDNSDRPCFKGLPGALMQAYNNHQGVFISPDDFWLTVVHGFSQHVLLNAEKLRGCFVEHEGKKKAITVIYDESAKMWENILTKFREELKRRVKADLAEVMTCDFSTTGEVEYMVSIVGLLCSMQKYFTYKCIPLCGICDVYIAGTLDDWKSLRSKVEALAKYELDWWIPRVLCILDKFVEAFQGKLDVGFWNEVALQDRDRMSSGSVPFFSGWVKDFYPYDKDGKRVGPKLFPFDVPTIDFEVSFIFVDDKGKEIDMKFLGAYTGMRNEGGVYRPQLTMAVGIEKPVPDKK